MDISDRRMMVKGTCSILLQLYDTNYLIDPEDISLEMHSGGIDDEV